MPENSLQALGNKVTEFTQFDLFDRPDGVGVIELRSDEVTANCPVTGQPDWYTVVISYTPFRKCLESKTVKLYLQSFRNQGLFCEAFAARICKEVAAALEPENIEVTVIQKPRGGVSITAKSQWRRNP